MTLKVLFTFRSRGSVMTIILLDPAATPENEITRQSIRNCYLIMRPLIFDTIVQIRMLMHR